MALVSPPSAIEFMFRIEVQHYSGNFTPVSTLHVRVEKAQISHQNLLTTLREVNSEVHDLVRTGWSMFYIFDVPQISPAWQTDAATGLGENDFLECALLKDTRNGVPLHPDMWRISLDGKATLIRTYWEDEVS